MATFDEKVGTLASLVEQDIGRCRNALNLAGGDLDRAVRFIFEGSAVAPTPARAVSSEVFVLYDVEDESAVKRARGLDALRPSGIPPVRRPGSPPTLRRPGPPDVEDDSAMKRARGLDALRPSGIPPVRRPGSPPTLRRPGLSATAEKEGKEGAPMEKKRRMSLQRMVFNSESVSASLPAPSSSSAPYPTLPPPVRKATQEPRSPASAITAYSAFVEEMRPTLPAWLKGSMIVRQLAEMWREASLEERQRYEDKATAAKALWGTRMADYTREKTPAEAKTCQTPFDTGFQRSQISGASSDDDPWSRSASASLSFPGGVAPEQAIHGCFRELLPAHADGAWTRFGDEFRTSRMLSSMDRAWRSADPPCLMLSSGHQHDLPNHSTGHMHKTVSDVQFKERKLDGKIEVDVAAESLSTAFSSMMEKVRYAPVRIDCAWRAVNVARTSITSRASDSTPPDLRDQIHPRPFALLDNAEDGGAAQPPHFSTHQLRPEQSRSLSWMLSREQRGGGGSEIEGGRTEELFPVEWRRFFVPGDRMGDLPNETDQMVHGAKVRFKKVRTLGAGRIRENLLMEHQIVGVVTPSVSMLGCAGLRISVSFAALILHERSLQHINPTDFMKTINASELEFFDDGTFAPGCLVQVRKDLKSPQFGWGGVTPGAIGILRADDKSAGVLHVKFGSNDSWIGKKSELVRVVDKDDGAKGLSARWVIDLRMTAYYTLRGGILADKIGYGKTATTIALIDSTLRQPSPPTAPLDEQSFLPARGTLIVVPSNLYDQWLREIAKFIMPNGSFPGKLQKGWSPQSCPWRIFAMSNVVPLKTVTAQQLAQADVVICSYRLLFSEIYRKRRNEINGGSSALFELAESTRDLMSGRASVVSGYKKPGTDAAPAEASSWQELVFPVLEMFHWHRVVFDEFHELECCDPAQQNSLQHLRAHHRWGLTGTPPVQRSAGVLVMSSLFRVDLPGYLPDAPATGCPDLSPWESDRLLAASASRFLDRCCRQNTAELPEIALEETTVLVHHTPEERALYLGQAHDAPDLESDDAFATEDNIKALERLMKLCSHFQSGNAADGSRNAKEEVTRIGDQKERRVTRARNQIVRCARVLQLLDCFTPPQDGTARAWRVSLKETVQRMESAGDNDAAAAKALSTEVQEAAREHLSYRLDALDTHRPRDPKLLELMVDTPTPEPRFHFGRDVWATFAAKRPAPPLEVLEALITTQVEEQRQNVLEYRDATASFEFFSQTVKALQQSDSPEARSCVVCLEEGLALSKLAITKCAHTFCIDCLRATVEQFRHCSICRQELSKKDIRPVSQEIVEPPPTPVEASAAASSTEAPAASSASSSAVAPADDRYGAYGSKLQVLARRLTNLRAEDPAAKVILFCQFDDLKRKVTTALQEFGIGTATLRGGVSQRAHVIRDWQNNANSSIFVLMLSLGQSASGTNLTAASHVVFLHPMLASTPERAIGYEMQAIGRARRHGQRRPVVHVWRFVTADTVEQGITEKHQAAIAGASVQGDGAGPGGAAIAAAGAGDVADSEGTIP